MQNKRHYLVENNEKTRIWSIQCWFTYLLHSTWLRQEQEIPAQFLTPCLVKDFPLEGNTFFLALENEHLLQATSWGFHWEMGVSFASSLSRHTGSHRG